MENIYKLEIRKKSSIFGKKSFHVKTEKRLKKRKRAKRQSKRKKVGEEKSLRLKDCRINSGKGGLSSFNGYYGLTCNG